MAKYNLLEIVQDILSDMNSDEVNSISDTVEALQVARIVRSSYNALFADRLIPENQTLLQINGLGNTARPTYLDIPENTFSIIELQYNWKVTGDSDYRVVQYMDPREFLRRSTMRSGDSSSVVITDPSGVTFNVMTNSSPKFWTTFNDDTIICDSYDASSESTLQGSRTLCWAQKTQTFLLEDTFTPNIDDNLFPLLIADSKSRSFLTLLGRANQKEEAVARQQTTRSQAHMWKAGQKTGLSRMPNYGRPIR